jgi:hypothetical protein
MLFFEAYKNSKNLDYLLCYSLFFVFLQFYYSFPIK